LTCARGLGVVQISKSAVGARLTHHELGESLARFKLSGDARRPEDRQSRTIELIDDAIGERILWTDDGQIIFSCAANRARLTKRRARDRPLATW
jgi:hypothetical protein